jgi:hypothetical protein
VKLVLEGINRGTEIQILCIAGQASGSGSAPEGRASGSERMSRLSIDGACCRSNPVCEGWGGNDNFSSLRQRIAQFR